MSFKTGDIVTSIDWSLTSIHVRNILQIVGQSELEYFVVTWGDGRTGTKQSTRLSKAGLDRYYEILTEDELRMIRILRLLS